MPKRQRVTRACDFCHQRGLKCRQTCPVSAISCDTCKEHEVECTQNRQAKKRGRKLHASPSTSTRATRTINNREQNWGVHQDELEDQVLLTSLFNVYLDTVHPNYPLLPGDIFDAHWQRWMKLSDRASYVLLMATCALAARHVESKAVFTTPSFDTRKLLSSETYLLESIQAIPFRLIHCQGLDYIQAFGLLALCAIQQGNYSALHRYLGLYHALVAQDGFHDESRWPRDITSSEVESRRRVYWCMYRLEVHSACVLGHMVRVPDLQSSVLYPTPANNVSRNGDSSPASHDEVDWLVGWNLDTDLYRLLEHALLSFRAKKSLLAPILPCQASPTPEDFFDAIARIQHLIPVDDVQTRQMNVTNDVRLGFQGANIFCKSQLAKMLVLIATNSHLNERCQVISDLIEGLTVIPMAYLKAFGSPMIHELSGVGHLFAHSVGKDITVEMCQEVKRLIICLSELFDSLAGSIQSAGQAGSRLYTLSTVFESKMCPQTEKIYTVDLLEMTRDARTTDDILSAWFLQLHKSYRDTEVIGEEEFE